MSGEDGFGMPPGGMAGMMQKAMELQKQFQDAQERAAKVEVVGESGGGLVRVTANGEQQIVDVSIDAAAMAAMDAEDREMLEDLIVAATNDALRRAKEALATELGPMGNMLKGFGLG